MSRLLGENIRPYFGRIGLAVVFMAVMAGATALTAFLMEPVVNDIFSQGKPENLWPLALAVVGAFAAKGAASYAQVTIMGWVGLRIVADNQKRLYAHLTHMDVSFFGANSTGRLLSRFTIDIISMRTAVSNVLTAAGRDTLALAGLVGVMFYQNAMLAAISFFVFPVAVLPIVRLGQRIRKVTTNTQEELGLFTTVLEQTFQGIRVVKSYGMEKYEQSRVSGIIDSVNRLSFKSHRVRSLSSPIMETLGGAAVATVIVYGGNQVITGVMDSGSFFSFITALLMAYEPLKRLASLNNTLQEGLAGAQRLFQLLDTEPGITERPDARPVAVNAGEMELRGVVFSYGTNAPALMGVDLHIPAGKTVALVGPSGGGKSTILNLIPRFFDVDKGAVLIDGTDVRDATFASLTAATALVSQEITLFDDTIRANIAYGREGASEDEIIDAATHAAAHEFIVELPDGYDTFVGERGIKLSGGQRQRLAIARAMLKNAPILLLDEATSALDTESERQVQAALKQLMQGRTTLVIAHRLSTVVDSDLIYVIDRGRVIEQGSHAELIACDGAYARLYSLQFADQGAKIEAPGKAGDATGSDGRLEAAQG